MIPTKPNGVFWSDEQWLAIHATGQNILVNAGAGSGKTAVLTERIIEILKKGVALESLVVLTFTKAAASEMKERLREKLEGEIKKGFSILQDSLDFIDQSAIQTFDSFALGLVKKYHYLLGVDRSINIGDSVIFAVKKKQIINDIFNEYYEEENQEFYDFINLFAIKNDNNVQNYIYSIDKRLELIADKYQYLDQYLDKYYNEDFIKNEIKNFESLLSLEVERIKQRLSLLKSEITEDKLINHIQECEEALSPLLSAKSYNDYLNNCDIKLPTTPRKTEEENQKIRVGYEKDQIKEIIKKLKEYLDYQSTEEMFDEILSTKKHIKIIIDILRKLDERFLDFKKSINSYEFIDIAKMAIKLVKENEELRETIKNSTHEILIDEYQDTSDIQEILISYIANNNVYMVGDIKQSIYRFRNANPDIFKNKYQDFKDNHTGLAIDLSKNFRSREEVLNNVNMVFSQIMSLDLGGVDYNDQHKLVFGNKVYSNNILNDDYNLDVLTYDYEKYDLKNHEIEAFIIANDIKDKVKNKYKIYDKDKKVGRNANFSDFVILTAEKKQFDLYKKIFEFLQIPLVIHKDEDFVRSSEIYVIKNILRSVYSLYDFDYYQDNFKDSLISVLRSFLVEASDFTISKIFSDDVQAGLKLHCPEIYEKLINISSQIEKSTTSEILGQIYQSFNIYESIIKIGNVEQVEDKLNYLLMKFKEFDSIGYTILDAIDYLEAVMKEDLDIEFSLNNNLQENVVNMMTIHKSKGLEFPVCYFAELDTKFNFRDIRDKVIFDKDYGIILPTFNEGLKDTFYKTLVTQKYKVDEISERMRVLYVALTRAKEKIIIVSSKLSEAYKEDDSLVPLVDRLNYKSLFSIISSLKHSLSNYTKEIWLTNFNKNYEVIPNLNKIEIANSNKIDLHQISLKKEEVKYTKASTSTVDLIDKESIKNMEFGTKIHKYFETLDFNSDLLSQVEKLNCDKLIKHKLLKFFESDLFRQNNIIKSYHEYQFRYEDGDIINGIIDLILETEDKLIIVDYKLSNLEKQEYQKQLLVYKTYLEMISSKPVSAYLYSILNEELKLVY